VATAPNLPPIVEAAGEQAVQQTVRLTLIQGGAAAASEATAVGVAEAGGAVAATEGVAALGAGGAALGTLGVVAAWTGVGLVVVGLGLLGYYLYRRSHPNPAPPTCTPSVTPCPQPPTAPVSSARPTVPATAPAANPGTQAAPSDVVKLRCKKEWDDCQKRQAREKVRRLNELANRTGGLERAIPKVATGDRDAADFWAGKFRKEFERISNGQMNPGEAKSGATGRPDDFMDPCLEQKWQKMKRDGKEGEFWDTVSPDHVQDIQLKGNPEGPLKWLDRSVNESLGSQIKNSKVNKVRKFILDCP